MLKQYKKQNDPIKTCPKSFFQKHEKIKFIKANLITINILSTSCLAKTLAAMILGHLYKPTAAGSDLYTMVLVLEPKTVPIQVAFLTLYFGRFMRL